MRFIRDWQAHRIAALFAFCAPWGADAASALFEGRAELGVGQELTVRRGSRRLTGFIKDDGQCRSELAGGVVAARLNVRRAGEYRIETTRVDPSDADTSL